MSRRSHNYVINEIKLPSGNSIYDSMMSYVTFLMIIFHSCDYQPYWFTKTKEVECNSQRINLGHQHGRRDVIRKHSIGPKLTNNIHASEDSTSHIRFNWDCSLHIPTKNNQLSYPIPTTHLNWNYVIRKGLETIKKKMKILKFLGGENRKSEFEKMSEFVRLVNFIAVLELSKFLGNQDVSEQIFLQKTCVGCPCSNTAWLEEMLINSWANRVHGQLELSSQHYLYYKCSSPINYPNKKNLHAHDTQTTPNDFNCIAHSATLRQIYITWTGIKRATG